MKASYKTIKSFSSSEIIIQKSRFIGWAAPVSSEKDALDLIQKAKDTYKDASHHCYAYTLGTNMGIMRYSDAGEPSGTAGLPMMEVIKRQSVCNCCAVVIRYFGGILLGAGGLLRAYSQSCSLALQTSGIGIVEETLPVLCEVGYSYWDRLLHALQSLPAEIADQEFAASVNFHLYVRTSDFPVVSSRLLEITDGSIFMLPEEPIYRIWETHAAD